MTKAQETYDEFIVCKMKCEACGNEVGFDNIIDWGYDEYDFKCPYCGVRVGIYNREIQDKISRLGILDRLIAEKLVAAAKLGLLHANPTANVVYWAGLMLIEKHFDLPRITTPLSYIPRIFMTQLYRELVEAGRMDEVDLYSVKAPIPVEPVAAAKVEAVSYFGGRGKKKKVLFGFGW